jgi:hypothetical protein
MRRPIATIFTADSYEDERMTAIYKLGPAYLRTLVAGIVGALALIGSTSAVVGATINVAPSSPNPILPIESAHSGDVVVLALGNYAFARSVNVPAGVTIEGPTVATAQASPRPVLTAPAGAYVFTVDNADNVTIQDLTINGKAITTQHTDNTATVGLSVLRCIFNFNVPGANDCIYAPTGLQNTLIQDNIWPQFVGDTCIMVWGFYNLTIANNEFYGTGSTNDAIHVWDRGDDKSSGEYIYENYATGLGGKLVELQDAGDKITVDGNWYENARPDSDGAYNNCWAYSMPLENDTDKTCATNVLCQRNTSIAPVGNNLNQTSFFGVETGGQAPALYTQNRLVGAMYSLIADGPLNVVTTQSNLIVNCANPQPGTNNNARLVSIGDGPNVVLNWDTTTKPGAFHRKFYGTVTPPASPTTPPPATTQQSMALPAALPISLNLQGTAVAATVHVPTTGPATVSVP